MIRNAAYELYDLDTVEGQNKLQNELQEYVDIDITTRRVSFKQA